jgi:hypothetical protein
MKLSRLVATIIFAAVAALPLHASPLLSGLDDADLWVNPPADASMITEKVPVDLSANLLFSILTPGAWGLNHANPSPDKLVIDGNAVKAAITAADGTDWHQQIIQSGVVLKEGQSYILTFRAKADVARTVSVSGNINGPDWHGIGLYQAIDLTTEWKPFTVTFTATKIADTNNVMFNIGQQNGTVWVADVKLTLATPPTPPAPVAASKVQIAAVTKNNWEVQIITKPVPFVNGKNYTITFEAKTDKARTAYCGARINQPDWHAIGDYNATFNIGSDWHAYSFSFTAKNTVADSNVVGLDLGESTGTVWIADFNIVEAAK